ncbi:MAG: urease accessory protein UreE [Granulosicoccus sp.]
MTEPSSTLHTPTCRHVERATDCQAHEQRLSRQNAANADEASSTSPAVDASDTITLDETERHRRRIMLTSDNGIRFLLDLQNAVLLRENDVLRLDDGRRIQVRAKPEKLYTVYASSAHHLLQLAWHVGNRHLATQIMPDHLRIREDRVIGEMLEELGGKVELIESGFDPEGGAYGDTHSDHHHTHT